MRGLALNSMDVCPRAARSSTAQAPMANLAHSTFDMFSSAVRASKMPEEQLDCWTARSLEHPGRVLGAGTSRQPSTHSCRAACRSHRECPACCAPDVVQAVLSCQGQLQLRHPELEESPHMVGVLRIQGLDGIHHHAGHADLRVAALDVSCTQLWAGDSSSGRVFGGRVCMQIACGSLYRSRVSGLQSMARHWQPADDAVC